MFLLPVSMCSSSWKSFGLWFQAVCYFFPSVVCVVRVTFNSKGSAFSFPEISHWPRIHCKTIILFLLNNFRHLTSVVSGGSRLPIAYTVDFESVRIAAPVNWVNLTWRQSDRFNPPPPKKWWSGVSKRCTEGKYTIKYTSAFKVERTQPHLLPAWRFSMFCRLQGQSCLTGMIFPCSFAVKGHPQVKHIHSLTPSSERDSFYSSRLILWWDSEKDRNAIFFVCIYNHTTLLTHQVQHYGFFRSWPHHFLLGFHTVKQDHLRTANT